MPFYNSTLSLPSNQLLLLFSFLSCTSVMQFSCVITLFSCAVTLFSCSHVQFCCCAIPRGSSWTCEANFKMAAGLLFLTFFALYLSRSHDNIILSSDSGDIYQRKCGFVAVKQKSPIKTIWRSKIYLRYLLFGFNEWHQAILCSVHAKT